MKIKHMLIACLFVIILINGTLGCSKAMYTTNSNNTNDIRLKGEKVWGTIDKPIRYRDALVTDVISGDTFVAEINSEKYNVQMIGITANEMDIGHQEVAKSYVKSMLLGKKVKLQRDLKGINDRGNILAYVWIDDPYKFYNQSDAQFNCLLLREGYVKEKLELPNEIYVSVYYEQQNIAKNSKKGVWANQ